MQKLGWKELGHKRMCKLLARARALPPSSPGREYVVQLSLLNKVDLEAEAEDYLAE